MEDVFIEFYEVSRRNIVILLVFWVSYIISYLFCAVMIIPSTSGSGNSLRYTRKRRSNLSRLVLLSSSSRRTKSVPVLSRSSSRTADSRGVSFGDVSESDSRLPNYSGEATSAEGIGQSSNIGRHLLSSFVPESTVAVLCGSVVLQGILLVPLSILGLLKLDTKGYSDHWQWQWLSFELLRQWWKWLSFVAVFCLLFGIPLAFLILEGREHRDAPMIRKFSIVFGKISKSLSHIGILKAIILLAPLSASYFVCGLYLGYARSPNVNGWLDALGLFMVGLLAIASVICIPLGLSASLANCCSILIGPSKKTFLYLGQQKLEVDAQIALLEQQISDIAKDQGCNGTPISSRSLRSKIFQLKARSQDLQRHIVNIISISSKLRRTSMAMLSVTSIILIYFFVGLVGLYTLQFFASKVLWYFPGIQTIDWLLLKVASTVSLVQEPAGEMTTDIKRSVILAMFLYLTQSFMFGIGLRRFLRRRISRVALVSFFEQLSFKQPVNEFLLNSAVLLISTVLSIPLLCLLGIADPIDNILISVPILTPYVSPLLALLPSFQYHLVRRLDELVILRFPALVWLILLYRSAIFWLMLLVVIRSLKPSLRAVSCFFVMRDTTDTPAFHMHID